MFNHNVSGINHNIWHCALHENDVIESTDTVHIWLQKHLFT